MKKILIVLLMVASCLVANAQNSTISLQTGAGFFSYYLDTEGLFVGLTYDYDITKRVSVSLNGNTSLAKVLRSGSFTTINTNVVEKIYKYTESEQMTHCDLTVLYNFLDNKKRVDAKVGFGLSYIKTDVTYPTTLEIQKGVIIDKVDGIYTAGATLFNIVLEPSYQFNSKIKIGLRSILRSTGGKVIKPLTRRNDAGLSITGINFNYEIGLKLGYTF